MLYTPKTKVALRICYEAHAGQLDRAGAPYVFHPFHVAEQMETASMSLSASMSSRRV